MTKTAANEVMEDSNAAIVLFGTISQIQIPDLTTMPPSDLLAAAGKAWNYGKCVHAIVVATFKEVLLRCDGRTANCPLKANGEKMTAPEAFASIGVNYEAARKLVYRDQKKRELEAIAVKYALTDGGKKKSKPQFADGATVFPPSGNVATVVHDDEKSGMVTVDEVFPTDPDKPQPREYQRGDLVSLAERIADEAKVSKKQQRIDDEMARLSYFADQYFSILGILLNAPKDASAEDIIAKMKAEAEHDYENLDADEAKRIKPIKWPKSKSPTVEKLQAKIAKLEVEIANQKAIIKDLKESNKTLRAPAKQPAAKPANTSAGSIVGVESQPTPHGFYYVGRKHHTLPYEVRNQDEARYGIAALSLAVSKVAAESTVAQYETEAATAEAEAAAA